MRKTLGLLLFATAWIAGTAIATEPPPAAKEPAPHAKAPAPHAEGSVALDDTERYKTAISDARRKLFAEAMSGLAASQLEAFWAVYADYEEEKNSIAAQRVDVVKQFVRHFTSEAGLSDEDTTEAVQGLIALQSDVLDLRLKYFDILSRRIDVKTAGRFALVDDYVTTSIRMDWLNQIPFPGDERK